MKYNDFPILNNSDYEFLSNQYQNFGMPFDRKTQLVKICQEISLCRNICFEIENKHNFKVKNAIEKAKSTLTKLFDNFSSTFNINITSTKLVLNLNLFSFLKRIIKIISKINNWSTHEQKEYYISMSQKSAAELLICLEEILSALEESNVQFFKHM